MLSRDRALCARRTGTWGPHWVALSLKPLMFLFLSLLHVPEGKKVSEACWEDVIHENHVCNGPTDPSRDQRSAVLQDTEGRLPVSWKMAVGATKAGPDWAEARAP